MTDQQQTTSPIPAQPAPPAPGPWADYLAAAQRLDAVRRAASAASAEHQAAVSAARQELSSVRARIAAQEARLTHELGVPVPEVRPGPADLEVAARAAGSGLASALGALQQARRAADAGDAILAEAAPARRWRPWARNLLVYGPFAAVVLIVQIALYLVASPGSVPTYALLCGLTMPLLAFGLGWVTIGFVYGGEPGGVDRTPIIGAVACLVPVLLTCMGVGLASFFN
ncbi:hypothetical protein [Paractinoplanes brasiliensis]|uniref:Uncharacterized protein n=1 Tax=Paractinoplanes brasiliensis TaxID=52695 RepID=A0A4R6JTK0_9ACTN|nr:hypothetical protein [Actinoplanes brasiliensis]TDO39849.1 hypothetical protein C8E87_3554 [Actinoplanes brasiliensis]GID31467.1 hypothetical protein Abr02nite_64500 [Actinoplanes brasiliensis]